MLEIEGSAETHALGLDEIENFFRKFIGSHLGG
jgi:hypothetical protein